MGIAFDIREYWGQSDAPDTFETALYITVDATAEFEQALAESTGGLNAAFLISGRTDGMSSGVRHWSTPWRGHLGRQMAISESFAAPGGTAQIRLISV